LQSTPRHRPAPGPDAAGPSAWRQPHPVPSCCLGRKRPPALQLAGTGLVSRRPWVAPLGCWENQGFAPGARWPRSRASAEPASGPLGRTVGASARRPAAGAAITLSPWALPGRVPCPSSASRPHVRASASQTLFDADGHTRIFFIPPDFPPTTGRRVVAANRRVGRAIASTTPKSRPLQTALGPGRRNPCGFERARWTGRARRWRLGEPLRARKKEKQKLRRRPEAFAAERESFLADFEADLRPQPATTRGSEARRCPLQSTPAGRRPRRGFVPR